MQLVQLFVLSEFTDPARIPFYYSPIKAHITIITYLKKAAKLLNIQENSA